MPRDSHNRRGFGRGGRMTDDIEDYPPVQCNNCGHCMTSSISRSQAHGDKRWRAVCPVCKNTFRPIGDVVISREAYQKYNNSPAGLSRLGYLKCSDCGHIWKTTTTTYLRKHRRFDGWRCPGCRGRNTTSPTHLKQLEEWDKELLERKNKRLAETLERKKREREARKEERRKAAQEWSSRKTSGSDVCTILKSHREILSDDPERLSTEFLKKLIGPEANDC